MIRHIAHKYGWQRDARLAPAIFKAYELGTVKASDYKTLNFNIKTGDRND